MAKRWRVMVNSLKGGTAVDTDNLTEDEAKKLLVQRKKKYKKGHGRDINDLAHFLQEYEESRTTS